MKKIVSFVLFLALLVCITACGGKKPPQGGGTNNPPAEQTVYEKLGELAAKNYSRVSVSVVSGVEGVTLTANYVLTQSSVQYSIEQLNQLPTNGSASGISPSHKTTVSGSAAVNGGEIVLDGESVNLPSYSELKGSFDFSANGFANVVESGNTFSADIASVATFFGAAVDIQNAKISVNYTETALSEIVITYQKANASVTTTYTFEA